MGLANAGDFSISPPQINLEGTLGQEVCEDFFIASPNGSILVGEDRWGVKGESRRKFSAHTLSSASLGLKTVYPQLIESDGEIISEICIKGNEEGNYHGLLMYRLEGSPTGIGVWVNVSLSGKTERGNLGLTGFGVEGEKGEVGSLEVLFGVIVLVLVGVLVFLVWRVRRKKKKLE